MWILQSSDILAQINARLSKPDDYLQSFAEGKFPPEHTIMTILTDVGDLIDKILVVFSTPPPVKIKLPPTPIKASTITPAKTIYKSKTQFDKAVHSALQQNNITLRKVVVRIIIKTLLSLRKILIILRHILDYGMHILG